MGVVFVSTAPLYYSVDLSSQIIFPKTSFIPPRMYKKYRLRRNKATFSSFFSVMVVVTSRFMKFSSVATLPYEKGVPYIFL